MDRCEFRAAGSVTQDSSGGRDYESHARGRDSSRLRAFLLVLDMLAITLPPAILMQIAMFDLSHNASRCSHRF